MKANQFRIGKIVVIMLAISLIQPFTNHLHSQQSNQTAIVPTMKVQNLRINSENPMILNDLHIDIKVVGQIAITTMDMTYYNPNSRIFEGEFNFPLAAGQTITRFALDIDGKLREGVVVEKEHGRKTFESIVRRGVDPGLLEKTEGNNFRMRVYPLPPNGTRRVLIAFEQELTDKGKYDLYTLPLQIDKPICKFSIHAEVVKNSVKLDTETNELSNLSFNKWHQSYIASLEQNDFVANKKIALAFPHTNKEENVFSAQKNINSDSSYFYLNIRPKQYQQTKVLPKKITVLWDNSNSAQKRDLEKELLVLENYIRQIRNLTVELVYFNIKTSPAKAFTITDGNCENLKSTLKNAVYDGGTSLGCIDFTKYQSDEFLLFSDGMSTFGSSEPRFAHTPINTLNSGTSANSTFLSYIAQRSGGIFVDLNKFSIQEAASLLTNTNYHFISAQVINGQVSGLYPSMPCQFSNTFSMVGTMTGKSATVILNFGFGTTITFSKTITITAENDADPLILSRLWAEKKLDELSLNEEKNKDEILRIGKQFGIVTSNTSLIVLENLFDYLNYNIVPPVELQNDYFKRKIDAENSKLESQKYQIESVVMLSNAQSEWWNTSFQIEPPQKTAQKFTPSRRRHRNINDSDELKSQEEINNVRGIVSIATVTGSDDVNGHDIADLKVAVVSPNNNSNSIEIAPTIQINAWDPQTPYLKVLQYAAAKTEYTTYLKLKKEYGSTPAFYTDVAEFFAKAHKKDTAVIVLSNLAELQIESPQLLRVFGNKLLDFKQYPEAVKVFDKVLKLKEEEPQSYRDMGLAYEANGDFQKAINTLYEVPKRNWDNRSPGIALIVMNEINSIIAAHPNLNYSFIDKRLIKKEPVNIRVILTWDTDNCDMDLWVTDPQGEKCMYSYNQTKTGGKISNDIINGYGPEEFMIRKALSGKYTVQANYFGTRSQAQLTPVNLHLVFITNFGKPNQKKQEVSVSLENQKDVIDVGSFIFSAN